ncbi:MAG: three-Cys-motif partner protein TcmP [Candidatus Goldbacteria bacterium]|nr:three-Cys-motif partner protein TcmP [Candidatus Goldiibacteriota bacterium]
MDKFYDDQTDLTAAKILIYKEYLRSYLPKVLMQYGKCYIADLFCGCGKNGLKDGSPLVLLQVANEILNDKVIKNKRPNAKIVIVFNDVDKSCCDNLKTYLDKEPKNSQIEIIGPLCEQFDSIKNRALYYFKDKKEPKFIFLDPFTYTSIGMKDIDAFMSLPTAEVLLFLPVFFSYRFVSCADDYGKLKNFIEDFTDKGCVEYDDIYDFNNSISEKMKSTLKTQYVRAICLDGGARKNALFYITRHVSGMSLMNSIVWKYAEDGEKVKAIRSKEDCLFDISQYSVFVKKFKETLLEHLKKIERLVTFSL